MAKQQQKRTMKAPSAPSPFEEARDELFQHIMRCGVVGSDPEHQADWFGETMAYMMERYPKLKSHKTAEPRSRGQLFWQPLKNDNATTGAQHRESYENAPAI